MRFGGVEEDGWPLLKKHMNEHERVISLFFEDWVRGLHGMANSIRRTPAIVLFLFLVLQNDEIQNGSLTGHVVFRFERSSGKKKIASASNTTGLW